MAYIRGTIFGIYLVDSDKPSVKDVLKPGRQMVSAGYCMYGSSSNIVISMGHGVNGYTLDIVIQTPGNYSERIAYIFLR